MGNNGERQTTASGRVLTVVLRNAVANGVKPPMLDQLSEEKLQQFQGMLLSNEVAGAVALMKESPDAAAHVEALLFDKKNEVVMLNAGLALVQYHIGQEGWDKVDGLLKSGDADTRAAGACALSRLSEGTALPPSVTHTLGDLLSDEKPETRQYSADALAGAARNEGTREIAISDLAFALTNNKSRDEVKIIAAKALGSIAREIPVSSAMRHLESGLLEGGGDVRQTCADALLNAAENESTWSLAISKICKSLSDGNKDVRLCGARALMQAVERNISIQPAVEELGKRLWKRLGKKGISDKSDEVRVASARALRAAAEKKDDVYYAINPLGNALSDNSVDVSNEAAAALSIVTATAKEEKTRNNAMDVLGTVFCAGNAQLSGKAAKALVNAAKAAEDEKTRERIISTIGSALSSTETIVKLSAANALSILVQAGIGIAPALDAAGSALSDRDKKVKKLAAWIIGNAPLHGQRIEGQVPALAKALDDGDEEVRIHSAWGLRNAAKEETPIPDALDSLGKILRSRRLPANLYDYAGEAMWHAVLNMKTREKAIEVLGNAAADKHVSWKAVWALKTAAYSGIDIRKAVAGLGKALSHKDVFIRQDAAHALCAAGEKGVGISEARQALAKASSDKDPEARHYASRALGLAGKGDSNA